MNITTYIRKEDEHLWKAIPNKAEWLHAALNNTEYRVPQAAQEPVYETPTPDFKKPEKPIEEPVKMNVLSNDELKAMLGTAIEDKPRHVCKENCYHWTYDINSAQYVNTLTGETKEAPEF